MNIKKKHFQPAKVQTPTTQWSIVFMLMLILHPLLYTFIFFDPYVTVKWVVTYFTAAWICIWLIRQKSIVIPKVDRRSLVFIGLVLLALIANYFYHGIQVDHISTLDRIVFWILLLFSFNFFNRQESDEPILAPAAFGIICLVGYGLYQFYNVHLTSAVPLDDRRYFYSTVGNINSAAQMVGFCLPAVIFLMLKVRRPFYRLFLEAGFVAILCYLYFAHCRSIYIGTSLALISTFFLYKQLNRKRFLSLIAIVAAICICTDLFITRYNDGIGPSKEKTKWTRIEIIRETLELIQDNPLGLGIGRFEFGFIPYGKRYDYPNEEFFVAKSPHSEILRYFAEDGAVVVILFAGLLISLVLYFRGRFRELPHEEKVFALSIFCVYLFETLIQFPIENPFPFGFMALFVGRFLAKMKPDKITVVPPLWLKIALFVITLYGAIAFTFSNYAMHQHGTNYEYTKWACKLDPYNWRACLKHVIIDLDENRLDQAEKNLVPEFFKRPYNYIALRSWGTLQFKRKNYEQACTAGLLFDQSFSEGSSIHDTIARACAPMIPDIKSNYEERYRQFLSQFKK